MKKWKKIQKSLIRKWRQTQCDWFGHQESKNVECSLVVGWSLYEPDEAIELTPSQAMDFHECLEELSEVDIRFNVNGHSIENGSIRLSYNIYEHSIMVTRVWLNGKETKELVDTIQQWLDNNQDFIK